MTATPIPVPTVESDASVAVIPTASVAPLDGPPDGERINVFTVAPKRVKTPRDALSDLREAVMEQPLGWTVGALALGYLLGRVLR